jgi:hypothetical protein
VHTGETATFTVAATGDPAPTCAWDRSDDGGATWTTIPGAAGATLRITAGTADDGARIRVRASNGLGTATSSSARLIVDPAVSAGGGTYQAGRSLAGYWSNGRWSGLPAGSSWDDQATVTCLAVDGTRTFAGGSVGSVLAQPGCWVDGTWLPLALPAGAVSGSVQCLAVAASRIYAGGFCSTGSDRRPCTWVDGACVELAPPSGASPTQAITALAVDGADLYAALGFGPQSASGGAVPGYYRNGTWAGLELPAGATEGWVDGIAAAGGEVVAAGTCRSAAGPARPGVWRNGVWADLPWPDPVFGAYALALAVDGGDTFVAGYGWERPDPVQDPSGWRPVPGTWRNGTWTALAAPDGAGGMAVALARIRGRVLVAGRCDTYGYWQDGTWIGLEAPAGVSGSGLAGLAAW